MEDRFLIARFGRFGQGTVMSRREDKVASPIVGVHIPAQTVEIPASACVSGIA